MVTHKDVLDIVFHSNVANPFSALEEKVKILEEKIDKMDSILSSLNHKER